MNKAKVSAKLGRAVGRNSWMKDEMSTRAEQREHLVKRSLSHIQPPEALKLTMFQDREEICQL